MPLHLESIDVSPALQSFGSVLIVSCPICPPVSLATDKNAPLIEFFKHGIKTPVYEDYLREVRETLHQRGIKTGIFTSYVPCTAACIWTRGQRNRLRRKARNYEAALVMGCESAKETVQAALANTNCQVILAMKLVGITNATMKIAFPLTVTLEDHFRVGANEQASDS